QLSPLLYSILRRPQKSTLFPYTTLFRSERSGRAQRVDSGAKQRLVGVDVAHPGDAPLVQQEGLDRCTAPARQRAGAVHRSRPSRSEEHTSELQSRGHLVCRLLLEKKKKQ